MPTVWAVSHKIRDAALFCIQKRAAEPKKQEESPNMNAWNTFIGGDWQNEINVRDFIQKNYTPY